MPLAKHDCATQVEDLKLLYAQDYLKLVSGPEQSAGPFPTDTVPPMNAYNAWPPGPRPMPEKWTDPSTKTTWTRVLLDAKWMYNSSADKRLFITASALYELIGVRKSNETGFAAKADIPQDPFSLTKWWGSLSNGWKVAGGAAVLYLLYGKKR